MKSHHIAVIRIDIKPNSGEKKCKKTVISVYGDILFALCAVCHLQAKLADNSGGHAPDEIVVIP